MNIATQVFRYEPAIKPDEANFHTEYALPRDLSLQEQMNAVEAMLKEEYEWHQDAQEESQCDEGARITRIGSSSSLQSLLFPSPPEDAKENYHLNDVTEFWEMASKNSESVQTLKEEIEANLQSNDISVDVWLLFEKHDYSETCSMEWMWQHYFALVCGMKRGVNKAHVFGPYSISRDVPVHIDEETTNRSVSDMSARNTNRMY
eukprot:CAMPEP_0197045438 /NCGR_PEP_ID=MMETSP1384-20130603/21308_1 /TAXON_ID=29189 /ORGANISM="Ammonia sp." /LENGTH=203 /DNA_ID=CAMNT_0042477055 /DNA_START=67 /DNA_END=676 /DNA_ORIENTATION=-